jgi:hypothetical protein
MAVHLGACGSALLEEVPCNWLKAPLGCSGFQKLRVYAKSDYSSLGNRVHVVTDFNARGKRGYYVCTTAEAYTTPNTGSIGTNCAGGSEYNGAYCDIDVWQAYIDGIWASSVDISVYLFSSDATLTGVAIRAVGDNYPTRPCPVNLSKASAYSTYPANCAALSTIRGTITVYDDGTASIS